MAELWDAGVRGASLDVVAAWKDVLLAVALAVAILGAARRCRCGPGPTGSRSSTPRSSLLYWLVPQGWLGRRRADPAGSALRRPARPDPGRRLLPRARCSCSRPSPGGASRWRSSASRSRSTAWGLVDVYLVPLQWWRDSGVPGLVRRAARARLPRASRGCRRTGSTTRATRTTRSAGSSRRSSARSRPRTCS